MNLCVDDFGAFTMPVTGGVVQSRACCVCDTPHTIASVFVRRDGPRWRTGHWVADVCSDECAVVSIIKYRLLKDSA